MSKSSSRGVGMSASAAGSWSLGGGSATQYRGG